MRCCASTCERPSRRIRRVSCSEGGRSTTTTTSNRPCCPVSTSSGMTWMTTEPLGAATSACVAKARTTGWMIAFRSARAVASPKIILPTAARSMLPSAARTPWPKRFTTAASPGLPGATACRARTSESTITAPRRSSSRATVVFPDAIPPVNPMRTLKSPTASAERSARRRHRR